ncbi:hypothetical protein DFH27DRAFT_397247 [Peziza echinospora]|nr:hypothetical protein DFH27DRAFT_397247 [Peziza echinospora]
MVVLVVGWWVVVVVVRKPLETHLDSNSRQAFTPGFRLEGVSLPRTPEEQLRLFPYFFCLFTEDRLFLKLSPRSPCCRSLVRKGRSGGTLTQLQLQRFRVGGPGGGVILCRGFGGYDAAPDSSSSHRVLLVCHPPPVPMEYSYLRNATYEEKKRDAEADGRGFGGCRVR